METKILALLAVFIAVIFVFGCTGGSPDETGDQGSEPQETIDQTPIADEQERPTYLCPLDQSKMTYNCEADDDCKMITCQSGAGDVNTCMGVDTEYEGVSSDLCFCKVTGEVQSFSDGETVTTEIKECRHV